MNTLPIHHQPNINTSMKLFKLSPFIKACEYCHETFEADHMLRKYCPQKYGVIDFCKYERKKEREKEKLAAKENVGLQTQKPPLVWRRIIPVKKGPAINPVRVVEVPSKPTIDERTENLLRIERLMDGAISKNFAMEEIDRSRLDILIIDGKIPDPRDNNYFLLVLGDYFIYWIDINVIQITKYK